MRNSTANGNRKIINHPLTPLRAGGGHEGTRKFDVFNTSFHLLTISQWNRHYEEGYNPTVLEPRQVVVYSRRGCHLCEVVKESLTKLSRRGGFTWQDVDVDSDSDLRRQFNDEVPVVFIDGRKAFKYRMDEREFLRKLVS